MKHHLSSIFLIFTLSILTTQNYQLIQSTLPKGGSSFRASPSLTYFAFRDVHEFNIYYQSNNTFTFLFSIGKYYTPTSSTLSDCLVLDSPPRAFCPTLTVIGLDQITAIRITNISQTAGGTAPNIDSIFITSTPDRSDTFVRLQGSANALIAITLSTINVFLWDSAVGLYTLVFTNAFANSGSKLIDITDDGAFFVQEIGLANSVLSLFLYSGGTYIETEQYDFGLTLTITKITITGSSSGGIIVVFIANIGVTYRFQYNSFGTFGWIRSSIAPFPSPGTYAGLSPTGDYLMQPAVDPPTIRLYKYDSAIFSYLLDFSSQELLYTPASTYLQIAEDGSFLYFQYQETVESSPSNAFSYLNIYYQCTIPYCLHCSGIGFCDICDSGFILSGSGCVCPEGTIFLRSICQSCNVNFCQSCSAVNVCSSCNDGYEIQGNICVCGANRTVSLNSSKCVQCFIADCLRCDVNNICSQYKASELLSSVMEKSNDLSNEVENLKEKQSIILGMLSALIIIILTILGIIIIRLLMPKSQQNNDTIQTAEVNQREQFKQISETNLKAHLQKSHLQQNPSANQIIFEQTNLIPVPKKRRGKKNTKNVQELSENIEVIVVSPVIQDISS